MPCYGRNGGCVGGREPKPETRKALEIGWSAQSRSLPRPCSGCDSPGRSSRFARVDCACLRGTCPAGFADVDAQLEQFPMNARRTPGRIVAAHPANQLPNLFGHRWTPGLAATNFPGPEQPKALAMPANDGFRLDNDQEGSPIAPSFA